MDLREYPLLNEPDLMLRLLRLGRRGHASLDDAVAALKDDLGRINEPVPTGDAELRGRLETVRDRLLIAGAIESDQGASYGTTALGAQLVDENPAGVDETVLATLPRYQAFLARKVRQGPVRTGPTAVAADDPHLPEYEQGYAAFQASRAFHDNPYDPDSVLHLAWENGWTEARDEAYERDLDR